MKNFLFAALGSLALLAGTATAQAQDRGQRGPQSSYQNGSRDWNNNNHNTPHYNNGRHNGHRRMSHADAMRMRRYQQHRRHSGNRNWAYQQGARNGRNSSYGNNRGRCGNGRW